jgi:hypothetical protein
VHTPRLWPLGISVAERYPRAPKQFKNPIGEPTYASVHNNDPTLIEDFMSHTGEKVEFEGLNAEEQRKAVVSYPPPIQTITISRADRLRNCSDGGGGSRDGNVK